MPNEDEIVIHHHQDDRRSNLRLPVGQSFTHREPLSSGALAQRGVDGTSNGTSPSGIFR
jgi:hypothetical protein